MAVLGLEIPEAKGVGSVLYSVGVMVVDGCIWNGAPLLERHA